VSSVQQILSVRFLSSEDPLTIASVTHPLEVTELLEAAKSRAEVPTPEAASEPPDALLVVHTRYQRGFATKSCQCSVRGRDRRSNANVSVQNTEFRLEFRHNASEQKWYGAYGKLIRDVNCDFLQAR
jgi:hypothetical protein